VVILQSKGEVIMQKIEAIIRPGKLEEVKDALGKSGVNGLTVTEVIGCGHQKGHTQVYRGIQYTINLLPKVKIEVVVPQQDSEAIIKVISESALTGEIGDGKIFVYDIVDAIKIRTGERGNAAL
jgi:nitrogen regulatory protein P-II 1